MRRGVLDVLEVLLFVACVVVGITAAVSGWGVTEQRVILVCVCVANAVAIAVRRWVLHR
jgi:hypothetical protein